MSEKNLEGLGGWLVLVGIGCVVWPIRNVVTLIPIYHEIFTSGGWEAVTDAASPSYHPLFGPFIIAEIIVNVAFLIAGLIAIYWFFTKRRGFPKLYISIIAGSFILIIVDALIGEFIAPDEEIFDADTMKELGRSIIGVVVWIPYMLVSKRVKATFVN
jgi:hypothetical protein